MKIAVQLYSFRDFFNIDQALQFCQDEGLQYVEPAGLHGVSAAALAQKILDFKLSAFSAHLGLELLEKQGEEILSELCKCGLTDVVIPYADANTMTEVVSVVARMKAIANLCRAHKMRLHYHTHSHDTLKCIEGKLLLDHFMEGVPELYMQIDVANMAVAKSDAVAMLKKWCEHTSILHIKDVLPEAIDTQLPSSSVLSKGGQPARMGEGVVDFKNILTQARAQAITHFVLESDTPVTPEDFVRSGLALLNAYN